MQLARLVRYAGSMPSVLQAFAYFYIQCLLEIFLPAALVNIVCCYVLTQFY
jgi:hypothetical protein